MDNVYNFNRFRDVLELRHKVMAAGDERWRCDHRDRLDKMFDIRCVPLNGSGINITEYHVKDKTELLDFFLLYASGFTACDGVRDYVEQYYCDNQDEVNRVLEPYVDGERPQYCLSLLNNHNLFCLAPNRVFCTLVLYGMYLLNVDISVVLKQYINEYGLCVLDAFFHASVTDNFSLMDTDRNDETRQISLEAIEYILIWLSGDDIWMPAFMVESILCELWSLADNITDLHGYQDSDAYVKDFDLDAEMEKMEDVQSTWDTLTSYMIEVLRLPYVSDCYPDYTTPTLVHWVSNKIQNGFKPHMNSKFINYMYQSTWITYCVNLLVMSIHQFVVFRLYTDECETEARVVVREIRSQSDVARIEALEKQVEKKQGIINDFEIKKRREMQALEDKVAALEEEILYYKEQQIYAERLENLVQDVNAEVSYEEMLEALQNCNIVVVGGHENWVSRMKNALPLARFGSRKLGDIPQLSSSVDAVFFKFDQSSHVAYFKVKSMCKTCGVPFYYISGTSHKDCVKQMYTQVYYA